MSINKMLRQKNRRNSLVFSTVALCLALGSIQPASAGPREQAKRIHDRLASVPPSSAVLDAMEAEITSGNALNAAFQAMDNTSFYDVTIKNMVTPWTNEEQTVFAPLNDYSATVAGMIRDNVDFREVLYGNRLYTGAGGLGLPSYSMTNNNHYETFESQGRSLMNDIVATTQTAVTGLPDAATAGVMTTRAAARAFFYAGTNRAMFRFTMMNYLCNDLEQVKDTTRPSDRIRQDVSRSPGGDSRIFLNSCVGCHSGMDPLAQAFAFYEWQYDIDNDPEANAGQLVYTPGQVQAKYGINNLNFEYGFITPDDSWKNYWRQGPNALLGWDANGLGLPDSGNGAKSMGMELANTEAFARCQVKKVFKAMCFRPPSDSTDRAQIDAITSSFKATGFNMKQVFAETAVYCMGD